MKIINDTPLATLPFPAIDEDGDPMLTVVAKGTFDIVPNETARFSKTPAPIRTIPVFWDPEKPSSLRYEDDIVPFKPCTDIIVNGTANAPHGKPLPSWRAGVRVGNHEKQVTVTGPRAWVHTPLLGWSLTRAIAVRHVPLRYELAFGGEGFDENPVGIGYVDPAKVDKRKTIPAPQILSAPHPPNPPLQLRIASQCCVERGEPAQKLFPAPPSPRSGVAAKLERGVGGVRCEARTPVEGFGAIHRTWQPRRARAGTFGEAWRESEGRQLPSDFDPTYWNAAHPDLCTDDFLRGNEDVTLTAMHPEHERLCFRLPGQIVGIGVVHASGFRDAAPGRLDTVFIDADAMKMELTWRATLPLFKEPVRSVHVGMRPMLDIGGAP